MSSARDSILGTCASRRLRRPTVSLARLLLLLCFAVHTLGQTFQYSRGWTNGRKRAFATPVEAHREGSSLTTADDMSEEDLKRVLAEGNRMEQGRLEALLLVLGNDPRDNAVEDGDEMEAMKQRTGGEKRKGGWRRNSLGENFLRRRRRRMAVQQEGGVETLN